MPNIGSFPVTGYPKPLNFPATAFSPGNDTLDWLIEHDFVQNRLETGNQGFWAPLFLPDGATVTKLTLYGVRTSTFAILRIRLYRVSRVGSGSIMAEVVADWSDGEGSKYDDTIDYATIDNVNYTYTVGLNIDPSTDPSEAKLRSCVIEWS